VYIVAVNMAPSSYKQNKFNLLREQSEGYSKLTAELTSSLGPAHSSVTGRPTDSYASIAERARPVWEKVISLIGYFDLDPNRALDVILDVLSVHLATHYTFFIALLSFSPWSGSYCRPTSDYDGTPMVVDLPPGSFGGRTLDEILSLSDGKAHDAQSASTIHSPRVLAQVLGFKFAYYHVSLFIRYMPIPRHNVVIVPRGHRSNAKESLSDCRNFNPPRLYYVGRPVLSCA
jgi:THO complex subunit 2